MATRFTGSNLAGKGDWQDAVLGGGKRENAVGARGCRGDGRREWGFSLVRCEESERRERWGSEREQEMASRAWRRPRERERERVHVGNGLGWGHLGLKGRPS